MVIDVILPTFNRENTIERAIHSVMGQVYQDFKLYIIDDGSTDKTQELLKKYSANKKIQILSQRNQGVSAARNLGISESTSPWVAFIDSDDQWLPKKLQKQVEYAQKNLECRFIHSEEIWIRNNVRVNPKIKFKKNGPDLLTRSLEFCVISPSTVLINRELLEEHGMFDTSLEVCEDYDLWLKILLQEDIGFIPDALIIKYGGHSDQLSTKYVDMDYWRVKSLMNIYQKINLTDAVKKDVLQVIELKSEKLIQGHKKHRHLDKVNEISSLLLGLRSGR